MARRASRSRNRLTKRRGIDAPRGQTTQPEPAPDQVFAPGGAFALRQDLFKSRRRGHSRQYGPRARRDRTVSTGRGHPIRAVTASGPLRDVAVVASLRAAALRQSRLGRAIQRPHAAPSPLVAVEDVRVKLRAAPGGNLVLFVVDASGSMAARKRMAAVKRAVLSFLLDAYQKRDWVGLIAFRHHTARLLAPPTNSVEQAERQLRQLPTGGRTPLAAGIQLAAQTFADYQRRRAALAPLLVLITDGRANEGPDPHPLLAQIQAQGIPLLVVDSEAGYVRLGQARQLAAVLGAPYIPLDELAARR